jgi:hypothetical protein
LTSQLRGGPDTNTIARGDSDRDQDFQLAGHDVRGKIRFELPMIFCIGFLAQFLIAGLTGRYVWVA